MISGAEAVAASALSLLASPILIAYLFDEAGRAIRPPAVLLLSLIVTAVLFFWLRRRATWDGAELAGYAVSVVASLAWLAWLAWPAELPVGHGPDLTHHLMLVDYIERHWRLAHDPTVESYLGEFFHYTPGSQMLAALAGAWTKTDGFHALYPVVAVSVALKAGFVFLVALRLMPRDVRVPLAVTSVLFLFLPRAYFIGSFASDSFVAQVVSELFAVAMWWAVAAWDERPWIGFAALFAFAGMAAFLTWPLWTGPAMLAFVAIALTREELTLPRKLEHLAVAAVPILVVAAMYSSGRLGWVGIVRTTGGVVRPWPSVIGWPFLLLSAAGVVSAAMRRSGRAILVFTTAIAAQALALFALAAARGADTPYMALKMVYLAIYPLAVCAALAIAAAWRLAPRAGVRLAWAVVAVLAVAIGRPLVASPRPKAVVSEPLYRAGQWARANLPPACIEYLVSDSDTAYWLHLAVLGNPRMSPRTADARTFDERATLVRWINSGGLPFAIADLSAVPRDVRDELDVLAQFDTAAVARRRGSSSCDPKY